MNGNYPLTFSVEYPDRELNRLTSLFRFFTVIPIAIVLTSIDGAAWSSGYNGATTTVVASGGLLFLGPLLMILFRQKYPRWWFDWNLQLLKFTNRVSIYFALMDDQYPSTDEEQAVKLDLAYPDVERELSRGLPLVKWLLAIPHYIVLFFLSIAVFIVVVLTWFSVLFTGRYPRSFFDFVEGVLRWGNRVYAYAFMLATDEYPPFKLEA